MPQRGAPKLGKDGKPVKDKNGKVIYEPYQIKVLNTINFNKSMHYNPFSYIHSEKDILKLCHDPDRQHQGVGKAGDDFWVKAETAAVLRPHRLRSTTRPGRGTELLHPHRDDQQHGGPGGR